MEPRRRQRRPEILDGAPDQHSLPLAPVCGGGAIGPTAGTMRPQAGEIPFDIRQKQVHRDQGIG